MAMYLALNLVKIGRAALIVGAALTAINLYGLSRDLKPEGIKPEHLRFGERELPQLPYEQAMFELERLPGESEQTYASRATELVAQAMLHVHWTKQLDPRYFHQHVPIWENYFLWLAGSVLPMPEFKRYHFTDYKKSLERGIGNCGDAAIVLSELLNRENISNQILAYPGHLVVAAEFSNQTQYVLDADFGVVLPHSAQSLKQKPELIAQAYGHFGYLSDDQISLKGILTQQAEAWDGVKALLTKKYYLERITYFLKWPLPLLLMALGLALVVKAPKRSEQKDGYVYFNLGHWVHGKALKRLA